MGRQNLELAALALAGVAFWLYTEWQAWRRRTLSPTGGGEGGGEAFSLVAAIRKAIGPVGERAGETPAGPAQALPGAPLALPAGTPPAAGPPGDATADTIRTVFAEFGVAADVVGAVRGPSVTRYEVRPGPGVKPAKVEGTKAALALRLRREHLRVLPIIPGKDVMGIEVPNATRDTVTLASVRAEIRDPHPLVVALGRDVGNDTTHLDLRRAHVLVAGATQTGKSVCLHSILCTVVSRATPAEVRLVLIDPKRVELTAYDGIRHLAMPVVTSAPAAVQALEWTSREMDKRYAALAAAGVRTIGEHNAAVPPARRLPDLLVFVDELADLMMAARDDAEPVVVRLLQLGKGAGVHLVLATQRPSTDVITGLIKAGATARVAFAVASRVDSGVVLDTAGAEALTGDGDALVRLESGVAPVRVQCALVETAEITATAAAARPVTPPARPAPAELTGPPAADASVGSVAVSDELYDAALRIVTTTRLGSTSLLQRRLSIGHARAGRIMDLLERNGVVGPHNGSSPRAVLQPPPKDDVA